LACYILRWYWYTRPKTVTHPGTNRARRALTSFVQRTPLTTTPRRQRRRFEDGLAIASAFSSIRARCREKARRRDLVTDESGGGWLVMRSRMKTPQILAAPTAANYRAPPTSFGRTRGSNFSVVVVVVDAPTDAFSPVDFPRRRHRRLRRSSAEARSTCTLYVPV